ncbi:Coiled-coil domain-containing protein 40 [Hondaea fermentalgiana]|uniref:Coiled-coil domain-containing protein 40 n=1 Tax=Hondaea fermentalgiana TaxID=2315210 RepID=A0A2R5GWY6_9STRA|nr:Coiled-coil domain-containing protein 40 [Hondaea fermentalgiana]|eukprot:GBG33193.1 Coiled-coil domain-containing protein 40 [Hondaea fermentalgiana]
MSANAPEYEDEDVMYENEDADRAGGGNAERNGRDDDNDDHDDDDDNEEGGRHGAFATREDAEEAVRAIGQTPMLDSVQEMLRKQQVSELKEKELALDDLREDLKRAQQSRETLGVTLYGLQQQLASLQVQLETTHNEFADTSRSRADAEQESRERRRVLETCSREVKLAEEKVKAAKQEENAVKAAVRQVEAYLEETRGEIAVMRRATHKTEEAVGKLEKKKQEQDLYIDSRVEKVKQLQEEIAMIEAQRQSQKEETDAAETTLREAGKEMQTTQFEKKQVMQEWNSTLIALQKRDEAHEAMVRTIQEKKEEIRAVRAEIEGYKVSASKVQFESEKLVERKVRQEHALKQVEDALTKYEKAYLKLSDQFSMLNKSLEQQDAEAHKFHGILANCNKTIKSLQSKVSVVDRQRHAVEEETSALLNDRTTMSKAAKNLAREAAKLQKEVHAKEMEVAVSENELSRIKIDRLNTQAHGNQLQEEVDRLVADLDEKDKMIEKYKLEIRQRHDQIEKKMYVKDRLNRKLEVMAANQEGPENLGPLEATIKNLTKETTALSAQNRELERTWLKLQTEFVQVVNEMEQETTTVHELTSTETILQQKKKRLDNRIHAQSAELQDLEGRVRRMHNDMHKLNSLIAEHKDKQDSLANVNEVMQAEFISELKELEAQSVDAEARIEKTKMEKQSLLDEIMESERQIKLWEKKIQLEKETQEALDPTVGQSEVKAMEKEIHRMKIRLGNLHREQEKMIKEMEMAILKRETIATRRKGAAKAAMHAGGRRLRPGSDEAIAEMTEAELRRKLKLERKEVKQHTRECLEYERGIADRLQESENMTLELEKASNQFAEVEDAITTKKRAINEALYQKQRNIETLNRTQSLVARYVDFARSPAAEAPVSQEEADIMLDQSQDQIETIRQTLKKMEASHPHLQEILDRVAKLLE